MTDDNNLVDGRTLQQRLEATDRVRAKADQARRAEEAYRRSCKALSSVALEVLGLVRGDVVENRAGLQYRVEDVYASFRASGSGLIVTLMCRRLYKQGRRAGATAASTTPLTLSEVTVVAKRGLTKVKEALDA